ncbi:MAG: hypothetical protein FD123_73 [Bacteroidetes bacterium]|nr:MAG: hypothetical protein FD123_73 [Bacteroidota bacterium]
MPNAADTFSRKRQLTLLAGVAAGFAVLLFYFFISDGYSDVGDGIQHYQIAKYSWTHPELFLHHWGKPFYILVSSPFAQFGYGGTVLFNLFCAAGTAWFAGKSVHLLGYRFAGFSALLTVFCPLYFTVAISGLTEPFFGFILVLSVWLMLKKKRGWAAAVVSFLPFIRSEGFLLLPLFGLLLLIRRDWRAIPMLALGTIVYSIAGGIATGDFLWVIHDNPYKGEDLYGSGSFFHFAKNNEILLGSSGVVLFLAAGIWTLIRLGSRKKQGALFAEELLLVYGAFTVYFIAHSIFWAYGLFGSYGLLRVMAAVTPLAAIAVAGILSLMRDNFLQRMWLPPLIALFALSLNIVQTLRQSRVPFHVDNEQYPAVEAGKWLKKNTAGQMLYCQHPFIIFLSDYDPFDRNRSRNLWDMQAEAGKLESGSIIIWDSHFGPVEGRLPLDSLLNRPDLENVFQARSPKEEFRSAGKPEWPAVYIFRVK